MSALVRFQGKVIWIQTSYGEPYPTEVQDGEESLLEMGHKEESLNGTTENGEYSSDVRQYRACWRVGEAPAKQDADLWLYRDRTVMLLKHYARMAVESGRLPSLLGRECFGTRVTPYAMASFEDMAILRPRYADVAEQTESYAAATD